MICYSHSNMASSGEQAVREGSAACVDEGFVEFDSTETIVLCSRIEE